jgi:hypothetical protein
MHQSRSAWATGVSIERSNLANDGTCTHYGEISQHRFDRN